MSPNVNSGWHPVLTGLQPFLAERYDDEHKADKVLTLAGLDTPAFRLQGPAADMWFSILKLLYLGGGVKSENDDGMALLLGQVREDYPVLAKLFNEVLAAIKVPHHPELPPNSLLNRRFPLWAWIGSQP